MFVWKNASGSFELSILNTWLCLSWLMGCCLLSILHNGFRVALVLVGMR